MSSLDWLATERVHLKRSPAVSGGQIGTAELHKTNLPATALCPVDGETRARVATDSAHTVYEIFVFDEADIRNGDLLVWQGREYPVRAVEPWRWAVILGMAETVRRLLIEEV